MSVRGAPAIGCVAAYGIVLASRERKFRSTADLIRHLEHTREVLAATRPTAVNLFWALEQMRRIWQAPPIQDESPSALMERLEDGARRIDKEDIESCRRIGDFGASLFGPKSVILTHCNAGALATAGYGTALGVVRSAHRQGKVAKVFVDETRPYLQGARLTAWELEQEGIPYEIITDNMAGHFMKTEKISAIVVGADRIAANGDTANKIGTYSLAVLAKHHGIPFYVAAPFSTIDLKTPDGDHIVIEERSADEVLFINGRRLAPTKAKARHPAFDATPHELISAIITESGVVRAPFDENLSKLSSKR